MKRAVTKPRQTRDETWKKWTKKKVFIINRYGSTVDTVITDIFWKFETDHWYEIDYKELTLDCIKVVNSNNTITYEAYI